MSFAAFFPEQAVAAVMDAGPAAQAVRRKPPRPSASDATRYAQLRRIHAHGKARGPRPQHPAASPVGRTDAPNRDERRADRVAQAQNARKPAGFRWQPWMTWVAVGAVALWILN